MRCLDPGCGRLTVAGHGAQKLFGWFERPGISGFAGWLGAMGIRPSRPWALVAALAEFVGGLFVAAGLLMPIAALVVCGSMLTAIGLVHLSKGFWASKGGIEFPLTILTVMSGVSLTGPGAVSLDQAFGISLPEPATWLVTALLVLIGVGAVAVSTRVAQAGGAYEAPGGVKP